MSYFCEFLSSKENKKLERFTKEYFEAMQKGDDICLRFMALCNVVSHLVLTMRHENDRKKITPGVVAIMSAVAQDGSALASHTHMLVQQFLTEKHKLKVTKRKRRT